MNQRPSISHVFLLSSWARERRRSPIAVVFAAQLLSFCASTQGQQGQTQQAQSQQGQQQSQQGQSQQAEIQQQTQQGQSQQFVNDAPVNNFNAAAVNNYVESQSSNSAGNLALNGASVVQGVDNTAVNTMPASNLGAGNAALFDVSSTNMPPVNTSTASAPPVPVAQQAVAPATNVAAATPSRMVDLGPPHGEVSWVGYNFRKDDRKLDVQIVTKGRPVYKIFQEVNRARQPELVVRFLNTELRHKIRRDIDATEFKSPVAFIRMRRDNVFRHTDVILTMRDPVQPNFIAKGSSIMLTFDIPERWFGPQSEGQTPIAKTDIQPDANLLPQVDAASDAVPGNPMSSVAAYVDDPGHDTFSRSNGKQAQLLKPVSGSKEWLPEDSSVPVPSLPSDVPAAQPQTAPTTPDPANPAESNVLPVEDATEVRVKKTAFTVAGVAQATGNLSSGNFSSGDFSSDIPAPITNAAGNAAYTNIPVETIPVQSSDIQGVEQGSAAIPQSAPKKVMRFDFRNATIGSVLRAIASESGLNFVMPPDISNQKVTVSLNNVSWDVALKAVLESNRLGMEEIGPRIIRIDSLKTFSDDRDAQDRAKQASEALMPTKVLVMRLSYANAEEAAKMVLQMLPKSTDQNNLAQKRNYERFKVQSDKRSNSVIVEAIPSELAKIKTLLERIDTRTPQVKIASRIVEIIDSAEKGLGISWGSPFNIDAGRGLGFGSLPFPNSLSSGFAVDPVMKSAPVGAVSMKLGSINNMIALDLQLKAMESRSEAESLQNQDIMIEDNQEATIVAGATDYFQIPGDSQNAPALTEVTYNTALKVTPHITADGAVQMKLDITGDSPTEVSAEGASAGKLTRKLTTTLLRKSGDTAVIGGLYSTNKSKLTSGVPYLSSIPIIGALFRGTTTKDTRRDLLIMVTPSIQSSIGNTAEVGGSAGMGMSDYAPTPSYGSQQSQSNVGLGNVAADAQWQGAQSSQGQQAQTQQQNGSQVQNGYTNQQGNSQQGNSQQTNTFDVSDEEGANNVEF